MSADAGNIFIVLRKPDGGIEINNYLPKHLTREQALNLATWIVAMLDTTPAELLRIIEGIKTR